MGTTTSSRKKKTRSKKKSRRRSTANGKSTSIKTQVEIITPRKAKKYLGMMKTNRRLRNAHVAHLERLMREGHWKTTGDAIRFNTKGELIDGQHRLQAVINSGVTIESLVVRNVQDDAVMDLDTGAARSPGDLLTIAGHNRAHAVAAVIRMASSLLEIESGVLGTTSLGKRKIAPATLLEWGESYTQELLEAVRISNDGPGARAICRPPSLFGALYFLFAQNNKKAADEFFTMLTEGIGYEQGRNDPVYILQRTLLSMYQQHQKHRRRPNYYKAAITIKAWNAFQDRQKISNLSFRENEGWPEINRRSRRLTEAEAKKQEEKRERRAKKKAEAKKKKKAEAKKKKTKTRSKKKSTKKRSKKKRSKKSRRSSRRR